jgi:pimeloyl-ACP methyl ester carboxylesterase
MATTTTEDGTTLYWEESGQGDPILLIQGLGWSGAMWFRLVPELETRYRVIRYDARGIGRSEVPDGPYSIPMMAADAIAVLDAAGVTAATPAHVFGCSLGGIVAQEVTLSYPDRVRTLTLCCTHPAGTEAAWPDPSIIQLLQARTEMAPEEAMRAAIDVAYSPGTPSDITEADIACRLEIPTSGPGYANQLTAGLGYPGTFQRLPQITQPVLIIHGDADQMVPVANANIMANALPDVTKVIIKGAGHVIFSEQPDAVNAALLKFLDARG